MKKIVYSIGAECVCGDGGKWKMYVYERFWFSY